MRDGELRIEEVTRDRGLNAPINVFLQSLADGYGDRAIATGLVDLVLRPEEMPEKILHYVAYRRAGGTERGPVSVTPPTRARSTRSSASGASC